jgi:hypothetical protein
VCVCIVVHEDRGSQGVSQINHPTYDCKEGLQSCIFSFLFGERASRQQAILGNIYLGHRGRSVSPDLLVMASGKLKLLLDRMLLPEVLIESSKT